MSWSDETNDELQKQCADRLCSRLSLTSCGLVGALSHVLSLSFVLLTVTPAERFHIISFVGPSRMEEEIGNKKTKPPMDEWSAK